MDLKTRCMVCGNNIAINICPRCSSLVCDNCYNKAKKKCASCSIGRL